MSNYYYSMCDVFCDNTRNEFCDEFEISQEENGRKESLIFNELEYSKGKELNWYNKLVKCFKKAFSKGFVDNIIVHGSFGNFTTTNYSDIELTVIISDEVFKKKHLLKLLQHWINIDLMKFIYSVDPLQHHGAFFLWSSFINSYDETVLPLCVYENSWSLRKQEIIFNVVPYDGIALKRTKMTYENLQRIETRIKKKGDSLYSIKGFTSNILMLPIFYYADQGVLLSKREAIARFNVDCYDSYDIIEKSTQLRSVWPMTPLFLKFLRFFFLIFPLKNRYTKWVEGKIINTYRLKRITLFYKKELLPIYKEDCKKLLIKLNSNANNK